MMDINEAYGILANRLYAEQYDCRTTFDEIYEYAEGDMIIFLHAVGHTDEGEYWHIYKADVSVYDEEGNQYLTHSLDPQRLECEIERLASDDIHEATVCAEMHQQHYYY